MNIDVAFAPTPVYVEAFGKEKAKQQAEACKRNEFTDRMDAFVGAPLEDYKSRAKDELKMAAVFFVSGIFFGFCIGQLFWSR